MLSLKKKYKIIGIGDIKLQIVEDKQTQKILAKNNDTVEKIWQKTLKEKGRKLLNGTLPNFIRIKKKIDNIVIFAYFIEYKYFIAQKKQPVLKLGIKPIGVSGMIVLKDSGNKYMIFAKRTKEVTEYQGFYELVPSGSIDKEYADVMGVVDYQSALLSEFVTETGLSKNLVKKISGFAFILDMKHHVYDICCKILLDVKKDLVVKEFSSSTEYEITFFVSLKDLGKFIKKNARKIVPTSMAIIDAYMKINSLE